MGKELDIWLANNQGIIENMLAWIFNNPLSFTVIVFLISLLALMLYDYGRSLKLEDRELLIAIAAKNESGNKKNNSQKNSGGINLQDVNIGRDLILNPSENKENIISEIKVKIRPSDDEKEKDFVLKRIQLINQDSKKLLSCYVTAISLAPLPLDGSFIKLASDDMVWAKSNSRVSNNRIDIVEGIVTNLYVARINEKKKVCEVFGINGLHTPIEKGEYSLRLRLDGENFESPKAFSVEFYYNGKKSLEFRKFSDLSDIAFPYSTVNAGFHKIKFNP
jgi:hypothetical protein